MDWKAEPFDECRWAVGPDPVRLDIVAITCKGDDERHARQIVREHNAFEPMLEAVRAACGIPDRDYVAWGEWKEQAHAAIAKAEGQ